MIHEHALKQWAFTLSFHGLAHQQKYLTNEKHINYRIAAGRKLTSDIVWATSTGGDDWNYYTSFVERTPSALKRTEPTQGTHQCSRPLL